MPEKDKIWDAIIVGGGPAGCNAAMVLARCHRKVLLVDEGNQRNIRSHGMHNYLTRDGMLPPDFLALTHQELDKYGVARHKARAAAARILPDKKFEVDIAGQGTHTCRRLLLATGVTDNVPDVPGMQELWGCAVFHCPFCDGWESSGKRIGLYAQRYNGYGMALALLPFTRALTLFTDGSHYLRAAQRQELNHHGIRVITRRVQRLVYAGNQLKGVAINTGEVVPCEAMFVHHGYKINNELALALGVRTTTKGAALINRHQQCNIFGLYVAGDASLDAHFVSIAAAHGARAGIAIHESLLKEDNAAALALNKD